MFLCIFGRFEAYTFTFWNVQPLSTAFCVASAAKSNLAQLKQVNRGMNRSPTGRRRVPCIPIDTVCLVQGKAKKEESFSACPQLIPWKNGSSANLEIIKKKNTKNLFRFFLKCWHIWPHAWTFIVCEVQLTSSSFISIYMPLALCLFFLVFLLMSCFSSLEGSFEIGMFPDCSGISDPLD